MHVMLASCFLRNLFCLFVAFVAVGYLIITLLKICIFELLTVFSSSSFIVVVTFA